LVWEILWSLSNFNRPEWCGFGSKLKLTDKFPIECDYIKKCRRVADDPLSYAWDVRRHVLLGMAVE
jgi:hypothetical protein